MSPVTLENAHVRLEPLRPEHAAPLWQVGREPRVWQHFWRQFHSPEDMDTFIQPSMEREANGSGLPFAVWDKARQQFVGSTSFLDFVPAQRAVEIGSTWLGIEAWGTSVNTSMKLLMLGHAFESLGLVRVQLKTDINNLRSQRALEKLGATREGVLRKHMKRPDGSWRDSVYFSIVDDEWPRIKLSLQQKSQF